MKEIWKDVKGFEGLYFVSNKGNVKNNRGKILKPWFKRYGYLDLKLTKNRKQYHKQVHRLVAEAFIPNPKNKPQVNHINGFKFWNTVENLEWVTNKENQERKVYFGNV